MTQGLGIQIELEGAIQNNLSLENVGHETEKCCFEDFMTGLFFAICRYAESCILEYQVKKDLCIGIH